MTLTSNDSVTLEPKLLPITLEKSVARISDSSISIYDIRSNARRLFILVILASAGLILTFSDSVYLPALATIEHDLHTTTAMVDNTISSYMICAGIFSLIWGPLSDRYGRKIILLISYICFLVFTIVCIFARSIIVLLIFRSCQGAAISASLIVAQSAIVDMYPPENLGFAMGLFLVPFLIGPIIGPFIGGILAHRFGWRSCFIALAIMTVLGGLLIILFVPETHHYFVMQRLSRTTKKKRNSKAVKEIILIRDANTISKPHLKSPLHTFLVLADVTIAPHIILCSLNFTSLFISLTLMSNRESEKPYSLSPLHIGFTYIPTGVFALIGSLSGGWISDWSAKRFSQAMEGRLILNLIGSLTCSIGLLLSGWTYHFGIHLALPLIGVSLFSFGESFAYTSVCAFINIKRPAMAGGILSLLGAISFLIGGIGVIVAVPLVTLLGFGQLYSLLAGLAFFPLCVSMALVIYYLRKAGLQINDSDPSSQKAPLETPTIQSISTDVIQWF